MKTLLGILFALSMALTVPGGALAKPAPSAVGLWLGSLSIGSGMSLRLVFHISRDAQGALSATMTSLDQSPKPIPAAQVTLSGSALTATFPQIHGRLDGTLDAHARTLTGHWSQGGAVLPLTLARTDKMPLTRPVDEPQPPFPYQSQDVTFADSAAPGVTLAGTLTLPPGPGPFPAVVLIAGSGPQTRDENIFGHRLFFVLADSLTRRGIAVLRYDKRGLGQSTGDYAQATTADFAADARAAVAYLKTLPQVNTERIGLIGHSEGGLIAPMVATDSPDIAFIVLMAGPGLPGDQILIRQAALIGRAEGASAAQITENTALQQRMFAVVRATPDTALAQHKLRTVLSAYVAGLPPLDREKLGDPEAFVTQQSRWASPWFRSFLESDPAPMLRRVECPVLALDGSRDLQVAAQENLAAIRDALRAGGNPDYIVRELPGLNHLFQTCKTGAPSEYASSPETISPLALQVIEDWVEAHTRPTGDGLTGP